MKKIVYSLMIVYVILLSSCNSSEELRDYTVPVGRSESSDRYESDDIALSGEVIDSSVITENMTEYNVMDSVKSEDELLDILTRAVNEQKYEIVSKELSFFRSADFLVKEAEFRLYPELKEQLSAVTNTSDAYIDGFALAVTYKGKTNVEMQIENFERGKEYRWKIVYENGMVVSDDFGVLTWKVDPGYKEFSIDKELPYGYYTMMLLDADNNLLSEYKSLMIADYASTDYRENVLWKLRLNLGVMSEEYLRERAVICADFMYKELEKGKGGDLVSYDELCRMANDESYTDREIVLAAAVWSSANKPLPKSSVVVKPADVDWYIFCAQNKNAELPFCYVSIGYNWFVDTRKLEWNETTVKCWESEYEIGHLDAVTISDSLIDVNFSLDNSYIVNNTDGSSEMVAVYFNDSMDVQLVARCNISGENLSISMHY